MDLFGLPDWNDIIAFGKVLVIALILIIVGILFLMNKLVAVPKPWSFILGFGFIGGEVYLVYRGGF